MIRWPGVIEPGTVSNDLFSHQDMLPTLLAAAGDPDVVEKTKKGITIGDKTFKVHLDGFNLLPYLKGEVDENPRPGFLYWSDEGDLMALRWGDWKVHFLEQRGHGLHAWVEEEVDDEDANLSFNKESVDRLFLILPAVGIVSEYLKTFEEFPPRQRPASFSIDQALEKAREREAAMHATASGG
jgi:arylsulfatase